MFLHSLTSRCNSNHLPLSPFPQGCTNVTDVARCNENLTPYVLVIGDLQEPSQAFIVVDQQIVTEVNIIDIPFALLSAFLCLISITLKVVITFILLWKLIHSAFLCQKHHLL